MLEFLVDEINLGGIVMYFLNNVDKNNEFIFITKNKYFVDKTRLIEKLNTVMDEHKHRFICVTRPRRYRKDKKHFVKIEEIQ